MKYKIKGWAVIDTNHKEPNLLYFCISKKETERLCKELIEVNTQTFIFGDDPPVKRIHDNFLVVEQEVEISQKEEQ